MKNNYNDKYINHVKLIYDGKKIKDEEISTSDNNNYRLLFSGGEGVFKRTSFNNNKITQLFDKHFGFKIGRTYNLVVDSNFISAIKHGKSILFYHGSYIVFYNGDDKKFTALNEFTLARKHILKNRIDQATMYHFLSEFCKKHNLEIEDFFKPVA